MPHRHPKASMYNGRRSIGRPKGIRRIHKDSIGSLSDRSEMENGDNVKTDNNENDDDDVDDVDQFDVDDIDMQNEIEMDSNSNDGAKILLIKYCSFVVVYQV